MKIAEHVITGQKKKKKKSVDDLLSLGALLNWIDSKELNVFWDDDSVLKVPFAKIYLRPWVLLSVGAG